MLTFNSSRRNARKSRNRYDESVSKWTWSAASDRASQIRSKPSAKTASHVTSESLSQGETPGVDTIVNSWMTPSSETDRTSFRNKKRSYKASNSSLSGNSFEAAITHRIGHSSRRPAPLSNCRSFKIVSRVFNMAELALKISSKNATDAVGKNPSVHRRYSSFSKARKESGPKISSGVVNRVRSRWKKIPPHSFDKRRPSADLAVPGGPIKRTCSPASIPNTTNRASISRSIRFSPTR